MELPALEQKAFGRIQQGMDVCDVDGHKIGTVAHIHEGRTSAGGTIDGGYVEIKTGFFGLGTRYYVPFDVVREITEGGVIVSQTKDTIKETGWDKKPADLIPSASSVQDEVVRPTGMEQVVAARDDVATPNLDATSWDGVRDHYRTRWQQHYGMPAVNWERYEPRYRFAWEMSRHPDYQGKSWLTVQPDLRQKWEVLHPTDEWDQVSDTVRDAWEHAADGAARIDAGMGGRAA